MKWRAIAMSAVAVLVACAMTFAQGRDPGARGDRAVMRGNGPATGIREILGQLNLTDEQKQKLDEIQAEFDKKLADVRENGGNPREVYQGYIEEVKGALNEEQLKKFNELQAQRGGPGQGGPAGRMGPAMGVALLGANPQVMRDLELTPEQQEKLRGILQKFEEELKGLREKYQGLVKEGLTPEQKEKFEKAVRDQQDRLQRRGAGGPGGPDVPRDRGGRQGGDRIPPAQGGPAHEVPPPPPQGDVDAK